MTSARVLTVAVLLGSCASESARLVASLPDFHQTSDRDQEGRAFALIDSVARQHLRQGMSAKQVEKVMGKPEAVERLTERIELWTYLLSISGTWSYVAAFLDGRLEFYGEANPQWWGDEDYAFDGGARLQGILRQSQHTPTPDE